MSVTAEKYIQMMRTRPSLLLIFACTLLLCSCKSLDRTVEISLTEDYYTGSFVRPTTPDKVRVYTDNAPLPLTTEVIGKFAATDPEARRNASLDVLLDTVKKEASRFGANGLFLTDHYKPHWLGSPQHVMYGYILLQPDTILKPGREHPLNTAIREYREQEEAKKQAEKEEMKRLFPPHRFSLNAGYSYVVHSEKEVIGDIERGLVSGLGLQASYSYNLFGVVYSGRFAKHNLQCFDTPLNGTSYQVTSVSHSVIPVLTTGSYHKKNKKIYTHYAVGMGYQWEDIYLRAATAESSQSKLSNRCSVMYCAIEYEYRIQQHWGVAARVCILTCGAARRDGEIDRSTNKWGEYGISLGINYYL